MRRAAFLVALAAAASLGLAGRAAADDVSGAELRALAGRAADDPAALARLRRVDSVDGVPADLAAALSGAEGDELAHRLDALASGPPGSAPAGADAARRSAARILAQRRFSEHPAPRPFRRPLAWLSDRVHAAGDAVEQLVRRLSGPLPGGERAFWSLLALLVVAAAATLGSRLVRRRARESAGGWRAGPANRGLDPRRLERAADEAERRGDLEAALRLRFRAGLLRLGLARRIPLRDSLTSGEVARRLREPEFDRLASTFDEVVYGGRAPERIDLEAARSGWARVLETAGAR